MRYTLKPKFLRAWATPGLFSYLLPAFTTKVTEDVGCPLSTAATLKPAASMTEAKDLVLHAMPLVEVARAADRNMEFEDQL